MPTVAPCCCSLHLRRGAGKRNCFHIKDSRWHQPNSRRNIRLYVCKLQFASRFRMALVIVRCADLPALRTQARLALVATGEQRAGARQCACLPTHVIASRWIRDDTSMNRQPAMTTTRRVEFTWYTTWECADRLMYRFSSKSYKSPNRVLFIYSFIHSFIIISPYYSDTSKPSNSTENKSEHKWFKIKWMSDFSKWLLNCKTLSLSLINSKITFKFEINAEEFLLWSNQSTVSYLKSKLKSGVVDLKNWQQSVKIFTTQTETSWDKYWMACNVVNYEHDFHSS
jgi:hypothetical protein